MRNPNCPLCRTTFESVVAVPKLESDPSAWFKVVDMNGDGGLSKSEIKYVLLAQLPIDEVSTSIHTHISIHPSIHPYTRARIHTKKN